jgi:rRNA maturation endonuclease Nob1
MINAPSSAINNRKSLQLVDNVGCYHCITIFPSKDIRQYTDNGNTAICPHCGADCLITETDVRMLKKIHTCWLE